MKKTFLAMLLLGSTMSMFAQTTGSGSTTGSAGSTGSSSSSSSSSTNPTTTPTTGSSSSTTGSNGSTMSGTNRGTMSGTNTTPINGTNTTTNGTWNNGSMNNSSTTNGTWNNGSTTNGSITNGAMNNAANAGTWNGVSTSSTSWTPETTPYWGWNSYGIWNNYGANNSASATGTMNNNPTDYNTATASNMGNSGSSMNTNGNLSSTGAYSAYGTSVASLPANIQTRFNQDFPAGVNNSYTWSQYGDWFNTYYMNNGRLTQYFYDTRGNGYSLALPVIQTYVPENIITSALQKYGASLYSISQVKTSNGSNAYQIGLLQHGQMTTQYLDDNGASVADVWRTEDMNNGSSMNATQNNAGMDNSSSNSMSNQSGTSSDMSSQSGSDMNNQSSGTGKTKLKIKHQDGSIDKIKAKNGHLKTKTVPASNSDINGNP